MISPRVLFLLKRRAHGPYGTWNHSYSNNSLPSGLSVSAQQMSYALDDLGINNKLVQVIDNNCIDREVKKYKPTHVIIEAFWVVPDKFKVLKKLHPEVQWIVRNHSKSDFLAHEGGMVGWAMDYISRGVTLACNSPEATDDFRRLAVSMNVDPATVVYLPNYYRTPVPNDPTLRLIWDKFIRLFGPSEHKILLKFLDVGCFGAIRPLKNHLHQAFAAIEVADRLGVRLRFWINGDRVEGKAEPILNSLRQVFKRYPQHELVELPWMEHHEFMRVIKKMNVVMQVSNSETFNIVAADAVAHHVPVLVSPEIPWLDCEYQAHPNHVYEIVRKLKNLVQNMHHKFIQEDQLYQLYTYSQRSKNLWNRFLRKSNPNDKNIF